MDHFLESNVALLERLTNAHSVSGHEDEVRAIFCQELKGCGALSTDKMGSVACSIEGKKKAPRVLVAGHMDEIGFLVQDIRADGFISFVNVGGWWPHTLLSQRVRIKNQHGDVILGVIASQPVHFLSGSQRNQVLPLDSMYIDIGADSRLEVEEIFGIRIGDPIAPESFFTPMQRQGYFMAKAFDNRVGMGAAIQAGQHLAKMAQESALDQTVIIAGSVQEEVGLRGALSLARHTRPDVAIVLEGPPADDTPGAGAGSQQGRLGGGAQIRLFDPSAIGNPRLGRLAEKIAREQGLTYQVTVRRNGGTDAGALHTSNKGIPCIVLGTPARYIHSHNAIISIEDYRAMLHLTVALVKALDKKMIENLTNFIS